LTLYQVEGEREKGAPPRPHAASGYDSRVLRFFSESSLEARLLVAVSVALVIYAAWSSSNASDVAYVDGATAGIVTPFVAPGDTLKLNLSYRGGKKAVIRSAVLKGPGFERIAQGNVAQWGPIISVKPNDEGVAADTVDFALPTSLVPSRIPVELEMSSVTAEPRGDRFENVGHVSHLHFDLRIMSPLARTIWCAGAALVAALWLAILSLVASRHHRRPRHAPTAGRRTFGRALFTISVTLAYGAGAAFLFAHALSSAFGWAGLVPEAGLIICGAGLPLLFGKRMAGPDPKEPLTGVIAPVDRGPGGYRAAARLAGPPTGLQILEALEKRGVRAMQIGAHVIVEAGGTVHRTPNAFVELTLSTPKQAKAAQIPIRFNDSELLLDVALALVPLIGPLELVLVRTTTHRYVIDENTRAEEVVAAFRAAQRDDIALADARVDLLAILAARRDAR